MNTSWSLNVVNGIGNLVFDQPNSEVNVLTSDNMKALDEHLDLIVARTDLKALLISSPKNRIFIAGADIREIEGIVTRDDAIAKAEMGKAVFRKLEKLPYPTVCVINGACLGGGYELALSCRYRVASFSPFVKIGLPEVNLGILPGFGGSIRLPKLLGLMKALPLILAGSIVSADQALKNGMVDALFPESSLLENAFKFTQRVLDGKFHRIIKNDLMTWFLQNTPIGRSVVFGRAKKDVMEKTKGHYPAPFKIIQLLGRTYGKSGDRVYRLESEHFAELGITDVSKNLIKVFFLSEKYKKIRWTKAGISSDGIRKCGIVGAGVMGGGIAQLVSSRDILVRVKDINDKSLSHALKEAMSIYQKLLSKRKMKKHDVENKMDLISVGLTNDGLKNCGIIIEAVVEDLGIKQKVFAELSKIAGPEVILASNTSSLPVTKMAEACQYPERVVGLHFFNPVNRMPLVEVIRAEQSSDEAIEKTILFARRLGKTAVVVADRPGFLVNRLLLPYMNEAAYLLWEGFGCLELDAVVEKFGMPMGPVDLVDQVGIDVGYKVAHILEEAFGARMKVAPILVEAKEKGLLGKKSGKGFYIHSLRKAINPELRMGAGKRKMSIDDALKRMIYVMINEAARCLEEKVIDSAATVDIAMIMGTGFPPFKGGLLRYADSVGAASIVKDLERFQKEADMERFAPSAHLLKLAATNGKFYN